MQQVTRSILSHQALPSASIPRPLVVFRVGVQRFAFEAHNVRGAVRQLDITPAPFAPSPIIGIALHEGAMLSVLDLRVRLAMPPRSDAAPASFILVMHEGETLALLVDKIEDVLTVSSGMFSPTPVTIETQWKSLTSAVVEHGKGVILLLEPSGLLTAVI